MDQLGQVAEACHRSDLAFGLELGVDFVALSFVRDPEDVLSARRLATVGERRVPVIAKLEKPQAIARLDDILDLVGESHRFRQRLEREARS